MEEKNSTKLIIAALALGLIICVAIIFVLLSKDLAIKQVKLPENKAGSKPVASEQATTTKYEITTLSKEEADKVRADEKTTCEKSELTKEEQQICTGGSLAYYMNRAMSDKDVRVCTLIDDMRKQQICIDGILRRLAIENVDENYCFQLSSAQSAISCTSEIYYYKAKNDPANAKTYCGRIKDRPFSLKCIKDFSK
ncbi:hypothetical protein HGA34_03085 [Candidatus Falkowbacteria bacterium]|nr:hypothetical protein [Candidatus Falkowbacteria bacterium]